MDDGLTTNNNIIYFALNVEFSLLDVAAIGFGVLKLFENPYEDDDDGKLMIFFVWLN